MIQKYKRSFCMLVMSILLMVWAMPALQVQASNNIYYVDAENGNDQNTGLSPATAFQSLDKLNSMVFQPGDRILFKTNCVWEGYFKPQGSGTSTAPIVVNAYDDSGNEVTGAVDNQEKPYIKCDGTDQSGDSRIQFQYAYAIHLRNVEYWELNNLQVSVDNDDVWQGTFGDPHHSGNKWTSSANKGRNWVGVVVEAYDYNNNGDKVIDHIYMKNLYVHDVDGNYALWHKDGYSGAITYRISSERFMDDGNFTDQEKALTPVNYFDDVRIEECYIKNSSRAGITVGRSIWSGKFGGYGGDYPQDVVDAYTSKNVYIAHNVIDMTTGDGIEVLFCDSPLIEYNLAIRPGYDTLGNDSNEFTSAGMWGWRSPGAVYQYNEVYGSNNRGDGQAWDVDWTNKAIYQYNYSHDNRGGSILYCLGESIDSIYRYNISQNDQYFIDDLSSGPGHEVYNNTFIAGPYTSKVFKRTGGKQTLINNIFYVPDGEYVNANWDYKDTYDTNLYYNISVPSYEVNPLVGDPLFVSDAPLMDEEDSSKISYGTYEDGPHNNPNYLRESLAGLQLTGSSPCIDAGKTIVDHGGLDFYGNPLYNGAADIGAHEYQGTINPPGPEEVLTPTKDGYVRGGSHQHDNYEDATLLVVKDSHNNSYDRKMYIEFSIEDLEEVSSAKLELYGSNVMDAISEHIKCYSTEDTSWSEDSLTWSNAPASLGSSIASTSINDVEKYYTWDVTAYIQEQISLGKTKVTFLLTADSQSERIIQLFSKENGANEPKLTIQ